MSPIIAYYSGHQQLFEQATANKYYLIDQYWIGGKSVRQYHKVLSMVECSWLFWSIYQIKMCMSVGWGGGLYNTHNLESNQYNGQPREGQEHI